MKHPRSTQNETLQILPTYKQASNNNTIQGAKTSMNKTWRRQMQEQSVLPSPKSDGNNGGLRRASLFLLQSFTIFQAFSKSRDWVTTPKLLQKPTK